MAFPNDLSPFEILSMSNNDTQANAPLFAHTSLSYLFLYLIVPRGCFGRSLIIYSSAIYEQDWCLEFRKAPGERQAQRSLYTILKKM